VGVGVFECVRVYVRVCVCVCECVMWNVYVGESDACAMVDHA